jgi:hypothetical protein
MCGGAATLMAMVCGFRGMGQWADARGSNLRDGGYLAWTLARMDPPVIPRTNPPALSPESWAVR